jgi:hypothetical protein
MELGRNVVLVLVDGRAVRLKRNWRLGVRTGYRGPPVFLCVEKLTTEVRASVQVRRDYEQWTRGFYKAESVWLAAVPVGRPRRLVGRIRRIYYDGVLAGDETRRWHEFKSPYPALVDTPAGPRFERRGWEGRVTRNGIVG